MPNRILRDWTDSETIDKLTVHAERFFARLIMKADDFGRYTANVKILKSSLFPLKTDVRETDISLWLTECEQCGLIALYNIAMRDYLQIENFNQRLRQQKEKFPPPSVSQLTVNRPPEEKRSRNRNEVETETETKRETRAREEVFKENFFLLEQVERVFIQQGGTKEMAQKFFNDYEAVGWKKKGSPITNFSPLVGGFITNWNQNEKNGNTGTSKGRSTQLNDIYAEVDAAVRKGV